VLRLHAEDRLDVVLRYAAATPALRSVRLGSPPHGFTRADAVAFLDVHVHAARQRVLSRLATVLGNDDDLALPLDDAPCLTRPSISEITAVSRGFRASKSSTRRGRPPVMSFVFVVSRGIFARTWPTNTYSASSTIRCACDGMWYLGVTFPDWSRISLDYVKVFLTGVVVVRRSGRSSARL
jgi:hypothetical protein